jgi:hypothetical protein
VNPLSINAASVKVMRSHDYCHFEVQLGAAGSAFAGITPEQVDELRKTAARLADKAVEQYKVAKRNFEELDRERRERVFDARNVDRIEAKPEYERTPEDAMTLKAFSDFRYRTRYDYEDDWNEL